MKTAKATRSPTQAPVVSGGALQDAHALLQAFVRASPLAVAVLDPKGITRLGNPAAERMLVEVFCQTVETSHR